MVLETERICHQNILEMGCVCISEILFVPDLCLLLFAHGVCLEGSVFPLVHIVMSVFIPRVFPFGAILQEKNSTHLWTFSQALVR